MLAKAKAATNSVATAAAIKKIVLLKKKIIRTVPAKPPAIDTLGT